MQGTLIFLGYTFTAAKQINMQTIFDCVFSSKIFPERETVFQYKSKHFHTIPGKDLE